MINAIHQLHGDDRVRARKLGDGRLVGFQNSTERPLTVVFEPVWEEICVVLPQEDITVELIYTTDLPKPENGWVSFGVGTEYCVIWQQHGMAADFAWKIETRPSR